MCRWFAYISDKEACLLEDVLIRPTHSIVKQVEDHYLPKLFHHVDKESDKEQRLDIRARNLYFNGHPFAFGRHIFMHNGGIAEFERIRRDICSKLSPKAYQNIHGTTDTEHLAALYFTHLGDDWDAQYSLEDMKKALELAIVDVLLLQSQLPDATTPLAPSSLNICTTDGHQLLAFRYRNSEDEQPPSLYLSTTAGVTLNRKFPGHPDFKKQEEVPEVHAAGLKGTNTLQRDVHGDHVIIASEPTTRDEDEWELIGKNKVFDTLSLSYA
ncbi:hypothetical protein VNI00_004940 [Paramarasmius palmivorus]|uniref:Glutamine amidotransferase type-2 domain-containing protein n=1 Tax=Paramarasmius palmivorus TaxID=297713 RepID=A0AAW0DIK0_9AGAR